MSDIYSSILINVKDEHRYLVEWVEHHRAYGFNHIYVVEDFNSSSHRELLKTYIESGFLSIHRMEDLGFPDIAQNRTPWRQVWMYNRFFEQVKPHENEWCLFLDTDEFLMFGDGYNLERLLQECSNLEQTVRYLPLRNFNASGHIFAPKVPTVEAYTSWQYFEHDMLCKSIIRADNPKVKFCCIQRAYDTNLIPKPSVYDLHPDDVWINHYFTKSWEDWCVRMRRGSQDENLRRVEQFFDIYNPDMRGLKNLLVSEYRNNQKDWFKHTGNFISDAGIKLLEMLGYPRV